MRKLEPLVPAFRRLGVGRSTGYMHIAAGLIPAPVSASINRRALPSDEVDALIAARIAGKGDDEIKALVRQLQQQRKALA